MKYIAVLIAFFGMTLFAQDPTDGIDKSIVNGLKFRNIGPAFSSGRIADIDIHPENDNCWYVAVGSGGVWKTLNAGVTWTPIFDSQSSYSIGCVTIDSNNPNTIWVGSGENVGGRHVGYGDGIYKSLDCGKSWKNMGLKESEHISEILVHPENSDIIFVAAQGPLWKKGGERGLYKSTDGGKTWKRVLKDNEWTGVTDVVMDPNDPDILIAATWQRHRNVAAYMGGGPGSGIHRSTDGGETWEKLTKGISESNLGKTGLAISPFNSDHIYAAIELDRRTGGIFMSRDGGNSWAKQSNEVSGATGPHYYQELVASPHHPGTLYLVSVRMMVSNDHGKTFTAVKKNFKHGDNHAITFRKDDPDYLLVGTDGGVYESFDLAENWRFMENLPVTQYYKLAVDDKEPFYYVYGGTQDNGTHAGPSRTVFREGIRNADWQHILGGDGHQTATEPGNPDIMYGESQEGVLHRIDRISGEQIYIQPQAGKDEPHERFNWDTPILVSPHDPARIYTASYRVWRSDNRGDKWSAISGDLTKSQERLGLPIMGNVQSWDNPWDVYAMSNYNTITSLSESPVMEGMLYAATDDGLIHVSEDGGESWTKIEVGSIKEVPATAFVNDIRADLFDEATVYAALDNHKFGDLNPYLIKSTNKGKTWTLINGNLPERTLIWRLVQDHERKELLFLATEFGIYFTIDGGAQWTKLGSGVPTISFRDITIQRKESDLVAASFGRGFYVLDDISPLRELSKEMMEKDAVLFPVKDALKYYQQSVTVAPGASEYRAENPPYGAIFTYYLKEAPKSMKSERKEAEKKLTKEQKDIPFPGWEALEKEKNEEAPYLVMTITDEEERVVDHVKTAAGKGIKRVSWDLSYSMASPLGDSDTAQSYWSSGGFQVPEGRYMAKMYLVQNGHTKALADAQEFNVKNLQDGALKPASKESYLSFKEELEDAMLDYQTAMTMLSKLQDRMKVMKNASFMLDKDVMPQLIEKVYALEADVDEINVKMTGYSTKSEIREKQHNTPGTRIRIAWRGMSTSYGPTDMHRESLRIGLAELEPIKSEISKLYQEEMPALEKELEEAGARFVRTDLPVR